MDFTTMFGMFLALFGILNVMNPKGLPYVIMNVFVVVYSLVSAGTFLNWALNYRFKIVD